MKYDLAVVIPVYNESRIIQAALSNFAHKAPKKTVFIIVDNNSTDNTVVHIETWIQTNPDNPVVLLHEHTPGALYARSKGLMAAKDTARWIISSDADCTPMKGFYADTRNFFLNNPAQILAGHPQHEAPVRLLKHLYLHDLMSKIAEFERIERSIFGPLFFGGYFGIRSQDVTNELFNLAPLPDYSEPTIYWSKHCYYAGYQFALSQNNIQTSSRRFWNDPDGFIRLDRSNKVRGILPPKKTQIALMTRLHARQSELILIRKRKFSRRLLMLGLDAIFFERRIQHTKQVDTTIHTFAEFIRKPARYVRQFADLTYQQAGEKFYDRCEKPVLQALKNV